MGRNVFQSGSPVAMIQAIGKVAPEALKPEDAFQAYQELAHELGRGRSMKVLIWWAHDKRRHDHGGPREAR